MFGGVVRRSFETPEARSFVLRVFAIMAVMFTVAAFEISSGGKDGKASGVAWFYAVAIYAACVATFSRSSGALAASSRLIAGILALAAVHNAYDLWVELSSKDPYEFPKYDADTWVSLVIAFGAVAVLFKFRTTSNPVMHAAWAMCLLDIVTNLENIVTIFVLASTRSKALAIGSDVFDVAVTLFASAVIYWEAGSVGRSHAKEGAAS
jgi:hypothetical protein